MRCKSDGTWRVGVAKQLVTHDSADLASQVFDIVLKNELAGTSATPKASRTPTWLDDKIRLSTAKKNLFQYQSHGIYADVGV
jgi:hypothetical protein